MSMRKALSYGTPSPSVGSSESSSLSQASSTSEVENDSVTRSVQEALIDAQVRLVWKPEM